MALDDSEATVTLGESRLFDGRTFFVYRVTGLTAGNAYELERIASEQVVAWPSDIAANQDALRRVQAQLEHAVFDLPAPLVSILQNEVAVTEEATPTVNASLFNMRLAGASNTTQTVFAEASPNTPSGGGLNSKPITDTDGTDRARRKIVYFQPETTPPSQIVLLASNGTEFNTLVTVKGGIYYAHQFVAAIPAGQTTETVYPAPSSRFSGPGVWQTIETLFSQNGIPQTEASELFFTRNVPHNSTTLTISYRGHANGNVFGAGSVTLGGVGGGSEAFTTFTLNDGSESATVEVRWYPSTRQIRVSVTERVRSGLPTINDVQVILSYEETRTVPATPATTREIAIEYQDTNGQVFAIKPSATDTLILVGSNAEVDTQFPYTTLFAAGLTGHLRANRDTATFYDYEDFEPIPSVVASLENHALLPDHGLFDTTYTRETVLQTDVTIRPAGLNISDLPTNAAGLSSGDVWFNGVSLQFIP